MASKHKIKKPANSISTAGRNLEAWLFQALHNSSINAPSLTTMKHFALAATALLTLTIACTASAQSGSYSIEAIQQLRKKMSETDTQLDQVMFPWCASDPNLSLDVLLMTPSSDGAVVGAVLSGNTGTGIERNDRVAKINDISTQGKRGKEFFTEILEVQMEKSARSGVPVALALTRKNADGAQESFEYKSKVSIKCKGAIFLTSTVSTSLRYDTHVVIPIERLSKFNDAELAALIGWNKALYAVRSENAPTKLELELLTQQARSLVAVASLLVIPNTMNKVQDPVATFKYTDQDILRGC